MKLRFNRTGPEYAHRKIKAVLLSELNSVYSETDVKTVLVMTIFCRNQQVCFATQNLSPEIHASKAASRKPNFRNSLRNVPKKTRNVILLLRSRYGFTYPTNKMYRSAIIKLTIPLFQLHVICKNTDFGM